MCFIGHRTPHLLFGLCYADCCLVFVVLVLPMFANRLVDCFQGKSRKVERLEVQLYISFHGRVVDMDSFFLALHHAPQVPGAWRGAKE